MINENIKSFQYDFFVGTIYSGLGYTSVNKYLQNLNIPNMCSDSYKRHEREIGPVIEAVAKKKLSGSYRIRKIIDYPK